MICRIANENGVQLFVYLKGRALHMLEILFVEKFSTVTSTKCLRTLSSSRLFKRFQLFGLQNLEKNIVLDHSISSGFVPSRLRFRPDPEV